MRKFENYVVIKASESDDYNEEDCINYILSDIFKFSNLGYELLGSITMSFNTSTQRMHYIQAMVKYEDEDLSAHKLKCESEINKY